MASRKTKAGSTNSPDKKLPLNKSIPLGIQHVLAMFAGNITVPIIVAGVFGQTPEQKIFLIQMALFVAGVATISKLLDIKKLVQDFLLFKGQVLHLYQSCYHLKQQD